MDKAINPAKNSHRYYSFDKKASFFIKLTINGHLTHSFILHFHYISNHFWYNFAGCLTFLRLIRPKVPLTQTAINPDYYQPRLALSQN